MAIYKAGRFLVNGDTFDLESDYVGKEYDAAKKELERISSCIFNTYKKYAIEEAKVFISFSDKQQILLCFCDKEGVFFAKCHKNQDDITTIFSVNDTKEISQISKYIIYKAENIMRMLHKKQYINQSTALENISTEYIKKKTKRDLEDYANER